MINSRDGFSAPRVKERDAYKIRNWKMMKRRLDHSIAIFDAPRFAISSAGLRGNTARSVSLRRRLSERRKIVIIVRDGIITRFT